MSSAGDDPKLQMQLGLWVSVGNSLLNARAFRLGTVALLHNSFLSCHRTALIQRIRVGSSVPRKAQRVMHVCLISKVIQQAFLTSRLALSLLLLLPTFILLSFLTQST